MADVALIAAGDVLGDRYVLRSSAWHTMLGPVWLARDRTLDRSVFIQFLSEALAGDAGAVRAFTKGASRVAQITEAAVVQVLDIGEHPPFAVLEHAGGGRLSERLSSGRAMEIPQACRTSLALARGLEALHARSLWHGSLSPETVLLDPEGRAKILSLGTVEALRAAGKPAIDPAQSAGYRPPERDPLPQDADRWALAAVLYHMLTGRAPEPSATPARSIRRSLPIPIDHLLRRALSPEQVQRPSLDEFEGALAPFARVLPTEARTQRFALSEFRWLVPAVLIVGLAVAALTVGVKIATDFSHRRDAKPTSNPTSTRPPSGSPLSIVAATDFDPPPGNGSEHADRVALAIDGDPTSSWATVGYRSDNVGGKPGVGLILDLGSVQPIARVDVTTSFTGWGGEIRVANAVGARADDFRTVATFTANDDTTSVLAPANLRAQYVLIWITRLVNDGADAQFPWRATISEAALFAP